MQKGPNLTTSHVKYLTKRYKDLFMYLLITRSIFASHSICSTVTHKTIWWPKKFVDKVRSTIYHRNILYGFTIRIIITKADLPVHFTIFHCRMNTIQPAWPQLYRYVMFSFGSFKRKRDRRLSLACPISATNNNPYKLALRQSDLTKG